MFAGQVCGQWRELNDQVLTFTKVLISNVARKCSKMHCQSILILMLQAKGVSDTTDSDTETAVLTTHLLS